MKYEKITHIDLFSGIGGFALAADNVFGKSSVRHVFCEIDPFCQKVLKKHWSESRIFGDIRTLTKNTFYDRPHIAGIAERKRNERNAGTGVRERIYLLTGGFPCQPFSQAGRRRGTEDDRFLWPEMLRVIGEFQPAWVIAENVRGLLTQGGGVVFERVCTDLEALGYEVQPLIIPAVAIGAPHRRDRVWFVAHRAGERPDDGFNNQQGRHLLRNENRYAEEDKSERKRRKRRSGEIGANASNSTGTGLEGSGGTRKGLTRAVANSAGLNEKRWDNGQRETQFGRSDWKQNWLEVATRLCRVDDGVPRRLDRNPRLKALGNAIVPACAEEIMRAIKLSTVAPTAIRK